MPKVTFIIPGSGSTTVEASSGISLLEVARDNNIYLEGACDGSLACSTCHVIVDQVWYEALQASSEEEEDLLDLAFSLTSTSRLGCQILMTPDLDGLVVTLPSATRNIMLSPAPSQ